MLQPKLLSVAPQDNYILQLTYETGEVKSFDVKPYITGTWFGELRETEYFRMVQVLPGGKGIEWSHGQDIAPHELYEQSVRI